MPNKDGTGPLGNSSQFGKKRGRCQNTDITNASGASQSMRGRGQGQGRGISCGQGNGQGQRRGQG